jgi:hypothetical protein
LLLLLLLAVEVEKGWTVNHRYLLGKRLLLILIVLIMQKENEMKKENEL